jgi:hypothetical protein
VPPPDTVVVPPAPAVEDPADNNIDPPAPVPLDPLSNTTPADPVIEVDVMVRVEVPPALNTTTLPSAVAPLPYTRDTDPPVPAVVAAPAFNNTLPESPFTESPDTIEIDPDTPEAVDPVDNFIHPLDPTDVAAAVATLISPLDDWVPAPDVKLTAPPKEFVCVVAPASNTMSPPCPALELPLATEVDPPAPAVEDPADNNIDPPAPAPLDPLSNTTPADPVIEVDVMVRVEVPPALNTTTLPSAVAPLPYTRDTDPPVPAVVAAPAFNNTLPESPFTESPDTIEIDPDTPEAVDPVDNFIHPLDPLVEAAAVDTVSEPLDAAVPAPDTTLTEPPTYLLSVVDPAWSNKSPPSKPVPESPDTTLTCPASLDVDAPPMIITCPPVEDADEPPAMLTAPPAPEVDPPPEIDTYPPVVVSDLPADNTM